MTSNGRRVAFFVYLGILFCLASSSEGASAFRPRVGTQLQNAGGKAVAFLTVNDKPAAALKAVADGLTPDLRATVVADRLRALVNSGLQPGEVTAQKVDAATWAVMARKTLLLLVPHDEAVAHSTSSEALARSWTATLRHLLAEPALVISSAGLTVPFGETRTFSVGGAALPADITAQDSDTRLTQTKFDPARRSVTVRALATGRGSVMIQAAGATVTVPVVVMKYAAQVDPVVTVSVTGDPQAPPEIVSQALYAGLGRAVNAEPNAELHLASTPSVAKPLASGSYLTVRIPMRIAGPDLLPIETSTAVTVVNRPVPPLPATVLFYSNNPEQLKREQPLLFLGRLQPFKPVRLDYHHQNMSGGTLVFHADLINESGGPASVQVISGISLPAQDTIQVGRRAGASFLKALNGNVGLVLQLPPHARVPIVVQRLVSGLTVSGIVQLHQITGTAGSVSVQVAADSDQGRLDSPVGRVILAAMSGSRAAAPLPDEPTDYGNGTPLPAFSPYVFSAPQLNLSETYSVGGKWAFVRIGHNEALRDGTGKFVLAGNYGADYEISLTLSNPTSTPRPVGIFFAPEAGLAAGVFRVDSDPIQEFDPVMLPTEPQLARVTLAPGETRKVRLQTIPLNGSFYPASIVVHAL